jgi:hypothetical protein
MQAGASLAESLLALCAVSLLLMAGSRTFSGSVSHSYCRASVTLSLAGQEGGGTDEASEEEWREDSPPPRRRSEEEKEREMQNKIKSGTLTCIQNLRPHIARQGGGNSGPR